MPPRSKYQVHPPEQRDWIARDRGACCTAVNWSPAPSDWSVVPVAVDLGTDHPVGPRPAPAGYRADAGSRLYPTDLETAAPGTVMVDFRNACAHGSRFFNRAFKRSLSLGKHGTEGTLLEHLLEPGFTKTPQKQNRRLYIYAAVLAYMLGSHTSGTNWHLTFTTQVKKLDLKLQAPDGSELRSADVSMGFPVGGSDLDLWKSTAKAAARVVLLLSKHMNPYLSVDGRCAIGSSMPGGGKP